VEAAEVVVVEVEAAEVVVVEVVVVEEACFLFIYKY
jgi:hypothetical protein